MTSTDITHAILLAAGLGKRMRPLTLNKPKPLIALHDKPLIQYNLDWLQQAGIQQFVVNTSYLAKQLETYLANHTNLHVTVSREEPEPLETGGGIVQALPHLGQSPFIAMNSDAIFPITHAPHPIDVLRDAWDDEKMDFLMLFVPSAHAYGLQHKADFLRTATGQVKQPENTDAAEYVFTGVELIHPRVFENCKAEPFSLRQLWQKSLDQTGVYQRVYSVVVEQDWLHVGDLQGLDTATNYLNQLSVTD